MEIAPFVMLQTNQWVHAEGVNKDRFRNAWPVPRRSGLGGMTGGGGTYKRTSI